MSKSNILKLGKESIVYGLGSIINKFISVLLLPILTRLFSPDVYGIVDLITVASSVFSMIIMLGLDSALNYYFNSSKGDEQKAYINNTITIIIFFGIVVCSLLSVFSEQVSLLFFKTIKYSFYLRLSIVFIFFNAVISFYLVLCRLYFKSWLFNFIVIGRIVLQLTFTLVFVVGFKQSVEGVFLSKIVSSGITVLIAIFLFKNNIRFSFSSKIAMSLLKYGIPLVPASIAFWVLSAADRYFLNTYFSVYEIGLYSVGLKIATIASLFVSSIQMAWGPFSMSIKNDENCNDTYSKIFYLYIVFAGILVLFIMSIAKVVVFYFATPKYVAGASVVGILSLSIVIQGLFYIVSVGLSIVKKTHLISVIFIISACSNVLLNILLVPQKGIIGAAIANTSSNIISTVGVLLLSQKFYFIDYNFKKASNYIILFFAFFVLVYIDITNSVWKETAIDLLISIVFILSCMMFKLIRIQSIKNFVCE